MRFQKKLLITYSLLIVVLVVVTAALFFRYSSDIFEKESIGTYDLLSKKLVQQIDNAIRPMDFITTYLISDSQFKWAIDFLASIDLNKPVNTNFRIEAEQTIRSLLYSYSIIKNFYAVVVFTKRGDFFSSNFMDHSSLAIARGAISNLPWLKAAIDAAGHSITVAPYKDQWRTNGSTMVFGRARAVPGLGDEIGFIEIQNHYQNLIEVMEIPEKEFVQALVLQSDGSVFYQSGRFSPEIIAYYRKTIAANQSLSKFQTNSLTGELESVQIASSDYSGLKVILVLNRNILLRPLRNIFLATLGIGFLIVLFSVVYTWVSSKFLTKPLVKIQRHMDETDLTNLLRENEIDHSSDEIAALDRAYRSLTSRLQTAVARELNGRTLWMQARLDSLQAQINPHFINNILTVIANCGLESGNERVGQICYGVASMLQYSTSTEARFATVAQELEHVETYLFLMKQRLEDQLSYHIEINPAIMSAQMPKMVFQQIVENSLSHGYSKTQKKISITICGYLTEKDWMVELSDNGEGIATDQLTKLKAQFQEAANNIMSGNDQLRLGIGGLGLLNTFSRLFLFYDGVFSWNIENVATGGVKVSLGGPLGFVAEGGENADNTHR